MKSKIAGYIKAYNHNFIDHIVPLCSLLDIPIVLTDIQELTLCKKYYPGVTCLLHENFNTLYSFLAKNFDTIIECSNNNSLCGLFFEMFHNKKMNLIFIPHGISDKFLEKKTLIVMNPTKKKILIYGKENKQRLENIYVLPKDTHWKIIGNFRKSFYENNKAFYDQLIYHQIGKKLPLENKTILYAPTWTNREINSSFFTLTQILIDSLPQHFNLIIKPHPSLKTNDPVQYYKLLNIEKQNCIILKENPLIYPILAKTDIYLGDFSSIGYDFLSFNKPMFFFDPDNISHKNLKRHKLFECGITIPHDQVNSIYNFIEKNMESFPNELLEKQIKVYHQTFDPIPLSILKETISSISTF